MFDRVDALIEDGTIGGDEPNAADFQIGATTRLLMNFDDLRPSIEGRPARGAGRAPLPRLRGARPAGLPGGLAGAAAALRCNLTPVPSGPGVACDSKPMEAATPLRHPHVSAQDDRVLIDGLVVADETLARLVAEALDPDSVAIDALEIGARVLDREQTGANAEFVKTEFEKVSKSVEAEFGERAKAAAEELGQKLDEVFDPDTGHLSKSLDELFSDGSSVAVQNRVKELVAEALQRSQADLRKQFASTDEGVNPLADFKARTVDAIKEADERQHKTQRALLAQMSELEKQLQGLRDEKQKLEELAEERERGTAKGRSYEEAVAEAIDSDRRRAGRRGRGRRRRVRGRREEGRRPRRHRRLRG